MGVPLCIVTFKVDISGTDNWLTSFFILYVSIL